MMDNAVTDQMDTEGQCPGDRIGDVQGLQCMQMLEYSIDPDDTEHAGTGQRDQHRHDGISQSTDTSDNDVHDTAQKVRGTDKAHTQDTVLDDFRITGVDT